MAPLYNSTVDKPKLSCKRRPRRSRKKRPNIKTGPRFAVPYFAHEALDPKLYRKNTRGAIGGPCPIEGRRESQQGGLGDELVDTSSDEGEAPADRHTVHAGKKRSHSMNSTKQEPKKIRVEGGRPAIPKKIVADLDSDDEIIVRMKEKRFTDNEIRDHLISEGRMKYNSKTISSRWARLRRVLEARADELLDEKLIDWHAGEDELLLQAVVKASAEVDYRKDKVEARRWKFVADRLKELKPTASYSKKACQARFAALETDSATIPPELDDNPEKRASVIAARVRGKEDKVKAQAKLKEAAEDQGANASAAGSKQAQVSTVVRKDDEAPRKAYAEPLDVTRSLTVLGPQTNPEDVALEAQGFSTDSSALTLVHSAAAANSANIGKSIKAVPGKGILPSKKHKGTDLPEGETMSKSSSTKGIPASNEPAVLHKTVKSHHASKLSKVKTSVPGPMTNSTAESGGHVLNPHKPVSIATRQPEATSKTAAGPSEDLLGPGLAEDIPQPNLEPSKVAKTIKAPEVIQGGPPKQISTLPTLSTSKRLALTLAKNFRMDRTYAQLRTELRARKLSQAGTKQEMSDRLNAADKSNAIKAIAPRRPGSPPVPIKTAITTAITNKTKAKLASTRAIPKIKAKVSTLTASKGVTKASTSGGLPKTAMSHEPTKVKKPPETANPLVAIPKATKSTKSVLVATEAPQSTNCSMDVVVKDAKPTDHKEPSGTIQESSRPPQPTFSISRTPIKEGRCLELSNLPKDTTENAIRNLFRGTSIDPHCFPVGLAFIDFVTQADALRAVEELTGNELNGQAIKLKVAVGGLQEPTGGK
ncbi:MAG: hypothetical protein M1836_007126 [Candelina mexicana]|nr:MAG: hypothetical protein M1836_007126 [Candelina mexicana]